MKAFAVLLLCLLAAPAWAFDFSGRWYGYGYQPAWGFATQWIAHRKADGSLEVEFRRYEDCRLVLQQIERGGWTVEGSRYTAMIAEIDGKPVLRVEAYELQGQDGDIMRYRHLGSGQVFRARRVAEDFSWPACSGGQFIS